jgi:hypothetical protein
MSKLVVLVEFFALLDTVKETPLLVALFGSIGQNLADKFIYFSRITIISGRRSLKTKITVFFQTYLSNTAHWPRKCKRGPDKRIHQQLARVYRFDDNTADLYAFSRSCLN